MVRLLRPRPRNREKWREKFQSHNGAIAARAFNEASIAPRWFQSHNGAIAALQRRFFR